MKIDKKYYWLIFGIAFLILYFILFTLATTCKDENCLRAIILGFILGIPCLISNIFVPITKNICNIVAPIGYFLLGALIGFLVYKIKK